MTSTINQLRMSMLDTHYHSIKNLKNNSLSNIEDLNTKNNDEIYAKDGEFKYEKAMDYNEDGIVTYDEYMRYCEENAVSQYSENPNFTTVQKLIDTNAQIQSIRPINIGKALNIYSQMESNEIESVVESEA